MVLVNLEVTDKLRIVILPSVPVRAHNCGAVCDCFGILPEPISYRLRSSPYVTNSAFYNDL